MKHVPLTSLFAASTCCRTSVAVQQPHGRVRGQIKVCVPKFGLQFPAALVNFVFPPEEKFSDVGPSVGWG